MKSTLASRIIIILTLLAAGSIWLYAQHPSTLPSLAPVQKSVAPQSADSRQSAAARPNTKAPSPNATTPTVGTPTATPATIVVNTPMTVTVTVQITDTTLISGSVNLLRVGATGTQATILGVMHDDGKNGDGTAGDHIYTLQVPFNEPSAGQIQIQVSAAFQGQLKRIQSQSVSVLIYNQFTSTSTTTPFTLSYPPLWVISASPYPNQEYLFPSSSQPNQDNEYAADIIVDAIPNPGHLDLSSYYSNKADVNYYSNSDTAITFVTRSGFPAVKFINVSGMIPTEITSVNTGSVIVEITDVGEQHSDDGILAAVADSVR